MYERIILDLMLMVCIILIIGVVYAFFSKSTVYKFLYGAAVFVNMTYVYYYPYLVGYGDYKNFPKHWTYIPECVGAAIKQLVGESRMEAVSSLMAVSKVYTCVFYVSAILSILVSFVTVLTLFGRRIFNILKCSRMMRKESCDVVIDVSGRALDYAQTNMNPTVIVPEDTDNESEELFLMDAGCSVLKKKFSISLFKLGCFNKNTRYNVIIPYSQDKFFEYLNTVVAYLKDKDDKNIYFYMETGNGMQETIQENIQNREEEEHKNIFGKYLKFYNTNELVARKFAEENPLTIDMESDFFEKDTSVKTDVALNVFMLGFDVISREVYRRFVINNQFVEFSDNEYRNHNVNYEIYSEKNYENDWCVTGWKTALDSLEKNKDEYFPLPCKPAEVKFVQEDISVNSHLEEICNKAKMEKSLSYFVINTGNVCRNIEIADQINLLLGNKKCNYRIFVYNKGSEFENNGNITFFGNEKEIFTHSVIVNESLADLAKNINKAYIKMGANGLSEVEIEEKANEEWEKSSYFIIDSNISIANSFRMKLNLLGLDYEKGTSDDVCRMLTERYKGVVENENFENCLSQSVRNAILAQEHERWNAHLLFSHYLPLKKSLIGYGCDKRYEKEAAKVRKSVWNTRKDDRMKKPACLTTYSGLSVLANALMIKTNSILETLSKRTCKRILRTWVL